MQKVSEIEFNDYDEEGRASFGRSTYTEDRNSPLGTAIRQYMVTKFSGKWGWLDLGGDPEITVASMWSGYSEYTITSTWDEISIQWGDHIIEFESMAEFFREIATTQKENRDS